MLGCETIVDRFMVWVVGLFGVAWRVLYCLIIAVLIVLLTSLLIVFGVLVWVLHMFALRVVSVDVFVLLCVVFGA